MGEAWREGRRGERGGEEKKEGRGNGGGIGKATASRPGSASLCDATFENRESVTRPAHCVGKWGGGGAKLDLGPR